MELNIDHAILGQRLGRLTLSISCGMRDIKPLSELHNTLQTVKFKEEILMLP